MKPVKTHKFRLGTYHIEEVDELQGFADRPDDIIDGKPVITKWKDSYKEIVIKRSKGIDELDTILHEAMEAEGYPADLLHDKEGYADTMRLSKFLWRMGYRRKK